MNPLELSQDIFWITTDEKGNILRRNFAWELHFKGIIYAPAIVEVNERKQLPEIENCDFTAPPFELTTLVKVSEKTFKSKWYLSSADRKTIDVVGFLCTTSTLDDQRKIDQLLFAIHHEIMQSVCHVKGLSRLLLNAPELTQQIQPRLEKACNNLELIVKKISNENSD